MKTMLLVLGFLLSPNSFASGLVEPFIGAETGKFVADVTYKGKSLLAISSTYSGATFGFRGGLGIGPLIIGPEVEMALLTTPKNGSIAPLDIGGMVGLFPGFFRVWASYFIYSKATDIKGTAMKGGVGIKFLQTVALNAEYMSRKYSIYTLDSIPGVAVTGTFKSYLLTLSFPLGAGDQQH